MPRGCAWLELLPVTVAKWLERRTLVNMVWGSNPPGGDILNMMQASLETCCEFATGLRIVGSGICSLLEMRAETVQKWTSEIQWKH